MKTLHSWKVAFAFANFTTHVQAFHCTIVSTCRAIMSHYRYFECKGSLSMPPTTHEIMDILESNHIFCIFAPAQCTDHLQPVDISINKAAKDHLRQQFQSSYTDQVRMKLNHSIEPENVRVDTKLTVIKTPSAKWLVSTFVANQRSLLMDPERQE